MRKLAEIYETGLGAKIENAYSLGTILIYPYLGNGWIQIFKDRQLKDKITIAIENAKN